MKTCINGATTMPYSLEDDIKSAGKTGFQGVQIWKDKLDRYLQDHPKRDLKDLISQYNLGISSIYPFLAIFGANRMSSRGRLRRQDNTLRLFLHWI